MQRLTLAGGVPDQLRGRVMSLYVLVFAGSSPIGGLFAGGVAELWGAPAGFVLGALFSLVILAVAGWQLIRRVSMPSLSEPASAEAPPPQPSGVDAVVRADEPRAGESRPEPPRRQIAAGRGTRG